MSRLETRSLTRLPDSGKNSPATHRVWGLVEQFHGGADYEFWTAAPKEAPGDLLLALTREFFAGDGNAADRLHEICEKRGRWA